MSLFGITTEMLRQGTQLAARRHELLSENVANAETPGYRARDLAFSQELSLAQQVRSLPAGAEVAPLLDTRLVDSPDGPTSPDGPSIDVDRQMGRVAKNALYQHAVVQLLNARFRQLRAAINGQG
jgi:flagellar basal-body rod protein FlgB